MNFLTRTGNPLPQSIVDSAASAGKDDVSRREFLAMASAFGATTTSGGPIAFACAASSEV